MHQEESEEHCPPSSEKIPKSSIFKRKSGRRVVNEKEIPDTIKMHRIYCAYCLTQ